MGRVVSTSLAELFDSICKSFHTLIKMTELHLKRLTVGITNKANCIDESRLGGLGVSS